MPQSRMAVGDERWLYSHAGLRNLDNIQLPRSQAQLLT